MTVCNSLTTKSRDQEPTFTFPNVAFEGSNQVSKAGSFRSLRSMCRCIRRYWDQFVGQIATWTTLRLGFRTCSSAAKAYQGGVQLQEIQLTTRETTPPLQAAHSCLLVRHGPHALLATHLQSTGCSCSSNFHPQAPVDGNTFKTGLSSLVS